MARRVGSPIPLSRLSRFELIPVDGTCALAELRRRRLEFRAGGPYPFLLILSGQSRLWAETGNGLSPDEILQASWVADISEYLRPSPHESDCGAESGPDAAEFTVRNSPGSSNRGWALSVHTSGALHDVSDDLCLALSPIREPWTLPAELEFGGWNLNPDAAHHCAMFRRWELLYGAEIVGVRHDLLECEVSRPPQTREAALELAREHDRFCNDLVDQGCGSLSSLAARLFRSHYWHFWWD